MLKPRNILVVAAIAAALCASAVALAASGGSHPASASATAYQRQDPDGTQKGYVRVNGTDSASGVGTSVNTSTAGGKGNANASARIRNVNLFGGLVTADAVSVAASSSSSGNSAGGRVKNLVVNGGSRGTVTQRRAFDMGGYGKLVALGGSGRGIVGLRATLTRAYQSYPAGSTVKVAYAATSARDAVAPPPQPKPSKPKPSGPSKPSPKAKKPKPAKHRTAPRTSARLTAKGFVFPVYGKHNYTDTFGAARADTGVHQGVDIFAPAGTPVVAVCDGSLNRVGTLPISGNRLWVKCARAGDSFFYAHLSSYATAAHSGAKVHAGEVIGFVGSTGDAEKTPPHLHFEVHPGDGAAVDPYPFLRAWENRRDVPAAAWVRANGAGAGEQPGTLVVVRDFLDR